MNKQGFLQALGMVILLFLCACGQNTSTMQKNVDQDQSSITWQEQYDLGMRYLSDGNYEEAIIAFTAAIEIDPKQAAAYIGRGNAYMLSEETEVNLEAAQTDYEMAIELDETLADAWLGLADVYIRQGNYEKALEVLRRALEATNDSPDIVDKTASLENGMKSIDMAYIEEKLLADYGFIVKSSNGGDYDNDMRDEFFFTGYNPDNQNGERILFYCDHNGSGWTELYKYSSNDVLGDGVQRVEVNGVNYHCDFQFYEGTTLLSIYSVSDVVPICVVREHFDGDIGPSENSEGFLRELILSKGEKEE